MNSRGHRGIRFAAVFLVSFGAFAQSGQQRRVIVVDGSGRPVNSARRAPSDSPAATVPIREIDRNEAATTDMCLSYVDAQLTYVRSAHRSDGYLAFAEKIRSASGTRDGLYWPLDGDGEESPMGPKFAAAAATELNPADAHPL